RSATLSTGAGASTASSRFPERGTAESVRLLARCANCYDVDAWEGDGLNPDEMPDKPHLPSPSLWPIGFAIAVAVILVGLIIDPLWVSTIGRAIALGLLSDFADGQWYIATFMLDPSEGETSRRTAFIRSNGAITVKGKQVPSFTVISNRCAHLGCPVQANGPTGSFLGLKTLTETGA